MWKRVGDLVFWGIPVLVTAGLFVATLRMTPVEKRRSS